MRICGIKFGHDGSVAVIEDGRLRFSIELEKIDNQVRHCPLVDIEVVFAHPGPGRTGGDRTSTASSSTAGMPTAATCSAGANASCTFLARPTSRHRWARACWTRRTASQSGFDYASWPHYAGHAIGA